jgi:hypothetical protein
LAAAPPATAQVTFTDVAAAAGVDNGSLAQGCAWGDYDSDGLPDLYLTSNRVLIIGTPSKLYHNGGAAGFTNQAATVGVDDGGPAFGAAWADIDNDGDPDLYLVRGAIPFVTGDHYIFRNDGPASGWTRTQPPVSSATGRSVGWADYDNDGFIDAYVSDGPAIPLLANPTPTLLHNNRDGTFSDRTASAGIADIAAGMGVAWGDYDNDGWPDLFLVNYGVPGAPLPLYAANVLYHNNQDGTFSDVTAAMGVRGDEDGLERGCFGAAWADYDNDGWLDLYVTCGFDNLAVVTTGFGTTNLLYHNQGGASFAEVGVATLTADPEGSFGCAWGDYDNDGYQDLYVANGLALQTTVVPTNRLFRYSPLFGVFLDQAGAAGVDSTAFSQASAWADYDRDGWLDLHLVETDSQDKLYHNDGGNANHWLEIALEGVAANRSGIGARVLAMTARGTQIRVVNSGSGYLSADDLVVHFGLGSATSAEVEIHWPGPDFCVQRLGAVAAGQVLRVRELCAPAASVLRAPYSLPLSAVFPLPAYLPLPPAGPWVDPQPVMAGPDALLFYQVEASGNTLRMVKSPPSVSLAW